MHADWLKGLMAGVAPTQATEEPHLSDQQPFPGFPAAGKLAKKSLAIGPYFRVSTHSAFRVDVYGTTLLRRDAHKLHSWRSKLGSDVM